MPLSSRLQRGFSLAEVLATVAVAGVLTAAAVPSFQSVIGESHRASAINQLVSAMHLARSEAITQNARAVICPGTDGTNCEAGAWSDGWFAFVDHDGNGVRDTNVDSDGDGVPDTEDPLIASGTADPRIDITTTSFPDALVYRPSGRIVLADAGATSGDFVICDNREVSLARVIIVPLQGHPRLSEKHAGGTKPICP